MFVDVCTVCAWVYALHVHLSEDKQTLGGNDTNVPARINGVAADLPTAIDITPEEGHSQFRG